MSRVIILLCMLAFSKCAFCEQNIQLKSNGATTVLVGISDVNSLSVKDDRILSVVLPQDVEVQQDSNTGTAFLRFAKKGNIKGFVVTEKGDKYQIDFVADDVSADSIVLMKNDSKAAPRVNLAQNYTKFLTSLLKAMYNDAAIDGFNIERLDKKEKLADLPVRLVAIYNNNSLVGKHYKYTNKGKNTKIVKESDFSVNSVRAVSLSSYHVAPRATIDIFVIGDIK